MNSLRKAAYKHLYLIYVVSIEGGYYHLSGPEDKDALPVLADYLGIQFNSIKIKVKDIGSNRVYLVTPERFRKSRLGLMVERDPSLENKLKIWFPFLWGDISEEDGIKYLSIIRQLKEYNELEKPLEGFSLPSKNSERPDKKISGNEGQNSQHNKS